MESRGENVSTQEVQEIIGRLTQQDGQIVEIKTAVKQLAAAQYETAQKIDGIPNDPQNPGIWRWMMEQRDRSASVRKWRDYLIKAVITSLLGGLGYWLFNHSLDSQTQAISESVRSAISQHDSKP